MAHVSFIHGIANKPPPADLLRIWTQALADAESPVPLGDLGVTTSAIYRANLLYEVTEENLTAYASAEENSAEALDASGDTAAPQPASAREAAFLQSLRAHLTFQSDEALQVAPDVQPQGAALERVPLPRFVEKRFMDVANAMFTLIRSLPNMVRRDNLQSIGNKHYADVWSRPCVLG